jgi:L-2,4-diaminobutyrate decarboxylase
VLSDSSNSAEAAADSAVDLVYSPALFEQLSRVWQQELSAHLNAVTDRQGSVLNWNEPADNIAEAGAAIDQSDASEPVSAEGVAERFCGLLQMMLQRGQNLHHPRYIGHQVPASMPIAALFDALGTVTNQVMAIYEMGPWATAIETTLIGKLCEKVGWDSQQAGGLLTHGGSLGNLTALLTARNVVFPQSWEAGVPSDAVLVAHQDAHYCVTRSAGILGLGTSQVVPAAVDASRRIDPNQLDDTLSRLKASGKSIMAVSACACATPVGAFDPLEEIADICRRQGVWLHVDAAHGGAALMSQRHRHLLNGISNADSVVWDAHKMLFVPALCAAVLYRDRSHRFQSFQQNAPYLFDPSHPGMAEFDSGIATVECTKRALGFGLWGVWSLLGEELFGQLVDRTFAVAQALYELVTEALDFESEYDPQCNIVVFRHVPEALRQASDETINVFQQRLRSDLIRSGEFYIVQTRLEGRTVLRACVMNPMTTVDDLRDLLETLRAKGRQILQSTGEPHEQTS